MSFKTRMEDPVTGVTDPLETLLYRLCYYVKFGHSKSNHTSILIGDPPEKFDSSYRAFQGHSRSSISVENAKNSPPRIFNAPADGFTFGIL